MISQHLERSTDIKNTTRENSTFVETSALEPLAPLVEDPESAEYDIEFSKNLHNGGVDLFDNANYYDYDPNTGESENVQSHEKSQTNNCKNLNRFKVLRGPTLDRITDHDFSTCQNYMMKPEHDGIQFVLKHEVEYFFQMKAIGFSLKCNPINGMRMMVNNCTIARLEVTTNKV